MKAKTYRVVRVATPGKGVSVCEARLACLEAGEEGVTTRTLYERLKWEPGRSETRENKMDKAAKAVAYGVKAGILEETTSGASTEYDEFVRIPQVAAWLSTLNPPNFARSRGSKHRGTRSIYSNSLLKFNAWLPGKTWSITMREDAGGGAYMDVRKDVEIRDVVHFLEIAAAKGAVDRDLAIIIRRFFADMNSQRRHTRGAMLHMDSAIKSFFAAHEIQYGLRIPRHMLRGSGGGGLGGGGGDDEWEDRTLKLSEFARMLAVGRPTVRDKAVMLSKFHRGMDQSTLVDRFNYTAFDQIASHMGTADHLSWDLDKCPVPIVLVRVKTGFKHTGFLEKDAVAANIEWIKERERLTGRPLQRGDGQPLYINKNGEPISLGWVGTKFSQISRRAGLCKKSKSGWVSPTRHTHQLRHLLKSTLIDAGCRIDVADHVIGHSPKDTYEKQADLYPDSLRAEYAKAAGKINIFTNFETSIDGSGDIHRLRAEVEADRKKLHETMAMVAAGGARAAAVVAAGGGGNGNDDGMAEMIAELREEVRKLKDAQAPGLAPARAAAAAAGDESGAAVEYQCIPCSLVHGRARCPSCGSPDRRVYAGNGGTGGGGGTAARAAGAAVAAADRGAGV